MHSPDCPTPRDRPCFCLNADLLPSVPLHLAPLLEEVERRNYPSVKNHDKGVGMIRAIFGTVQDTLVFVIFCLNMLYLSKNWCFKAIFLFFYILGLKVQKPTKNRRFLEKFNIFYIVISKYILLSPYVHIKQLHSYQNTILTFAEYNCLFLG